MFQLRAIDRRRLQERIGTVGAEALNTIFEELGKLIGRSGFAQKVSGVRYG